MAVALLWIVRRFYIMRTYSIIILILSLTSISVLADGKTSSPQKSPPSGGWTMSFYGDVSGQQYKTDLRSSDLTNTPTWSFQTENPPVSVGEGVQLATNGLTKILGSLKGWSRGDITLKEWPGGYWIYKIDFQGPIYSHSQSQSGLPRFQSQSGLAVFVLMNGRVICPKPIQKGKTPNNALEPTATAPSVSTEP